MTPALLAEVKDAAGEVWRSVKPGELPRVHFLCANTDDVCDALARVYDLAREWSESKGQHMMLPDVGAKLLKLVEGT